MDDAELRKLLLSLTPGRRGDVVQEAGATAFLPENREPITVVNTLVQWSNETPNHRRALLAALRPERDAVLDNWITYERERLSKLPIIGFGPNTCQEIDLEDGFVPLQLDPRFDLHVQRSPRGSRRAAPNAADDADVGDRHSLISAAWRSDAAEEVDEDGHIEARPSPATGSTRTNADMDLDAAASTDPSVGLHAVGPPSAPGRPLAGPPAPHTAPPPGSAGAASELSAPPRAPRARYGDDLHLAGAITDTMASGGKMLGLVLLGRPGCGKTTLLKHAWCVADARGSDALGFPAGLRPVLLRAARLLPLCRADVPDRELLPLALRAELDAHSYARTTERLLEERLLWLLDGLDEVGDPDRRRDLAERLARAMSHRPHDRYLLTCRSSGWRDVQGLLPKLRAWVVAPLARAQIKPFVGKWYAAVETAHEARASTRDATLAHAAARAKDLHERVITQEWLASRQRLDLIHNPLLLSILCLVHRENPVLPNSRAPLYERGLQAMLSTSRLYGPYQRERPEHARYPGLPYADGVELLGAIAWAAQNQEASADVKELTTHEAIAWLKPAWELLNWSGGGEKPPPEEILRRAAYDCGVLQPAGPDAWQFAHLTFQEFLAAKHAAKQEGGGTLLADRAHLASWHEPIRLAMRSERMPTEFFDALLQLPTTPWEDGPDADRDAFVALLREALLEAVSMPVKPLVAAVERATRAVRPSPWAWLCAQMRDRFNWANAGPPHSQRVALILALFDGRDMPTTLEAALKDAVRAGVPVSEGWQVRLGLGPALPRGDVGALWVLALPGANDDPKAPPWSPRHLHLLPVPGGTFWMGATKDPAGPNFDPEAGDHEGPPREVTVSDFWLGAHPVTIAQYRTFVAATGHREATSERREGFNGDGQPVTGVDWADARAFCAWVSSQLPKGLVCDLPTEAAWERAARGDDGKRYPWGRDPPSPERAVFGGKPLQAVGGRAQGAGPYGHHDLAGQVWEWCLDAYGPSDVLSTDDIDLWYDAEGAAPRIVRGGSWRILAGGLRAAFRSDWRPVYRRDFLGFRVCVRREPG